MVDVAPAEQTGSVHEFFDRARRLLTFDVPPGLTDPSIVPQRGDHDLEPVMREIAEIRPIRPAAVLIPVVDRPEPTVLLTQRSTELADHAGQIAFPGGKVDPGDSSPLDTALREAREEIGLDRRLTEPIGYLDLYATTLGYRIVPTLARVIPDFRLSLNRSEVHDAFEVPLDFLMRPENYQRHFREWKGMMRSYYAIPFGERYIWGVTAGILRGLYDRLWAV